MKEKKKKLVDIDPPPPPDNLRCCRTDGRRWRCKNLIADNTKRFCTQHYQAFLKKSPLKSKRKSNTNHNKKKIKKDEEIPSETQLKKTSLEENGGVDIGGGLVEEQSVTVAARVSNPGSSGGGGSWSKKGSRTKFTEEQKEKMVEFGGRLGWRIKKQNEVEVQKFCDETGIKRLALKVWLNNTRKSLARVLNPSGCGGSSSKKFVPRVLIPTGCGRSSSKKGIPRTRYTKEQKDKMLVFGEKIGWRIEKQDEDAARQLCHGIGVTRRNLTIWLCNKKHRFGKVTDYEKVELIHRVREKKVETRKRCLEAETKKYSEHSKFGETMEHVLEEDIEVYKSKCHELSVELEKEKKECNAIQDKYRDGLKEWISCLEDQKFICEREKMAQERITNLRITRLEEENRLLCEREKKAQERVTYLELEEELQESPSEKIHASAFTGYKFQEGRANSQLERRNVETSKQRLETETKRCSEESKSEDLEEIMKYVGELEKDLEAYKTKCHEISVELQKKEMELIAVQAKYGDGLKEWTSYLEDQKVIGKREKRAEEAITNLRITNLEEDKKVICEREKRVQERNTSLEEELRKMKRDESEKYIQVKMDCRYLECAKRRAEDEVEAWKKRFCELETRILRMEEANSTLRCMETHVCGKSELGPGSLQNEASYSDVQIREKESTKMSKNLAKTNGETNSSHVAHLLTKEEVLNTNEKIPASAFAGPSSLNMLSSVRLASDGVSVKIRNSDNSSIRSWDNEKDLASKKCLKRPCSDQRGDEYGSSCEDFTFTSTRKQKRTSEIVTSESEDSKWKFEADMLTSFEKNPELCMKAVCALYRQQTSEEKSVKGVLHYNNREFNKFDALRGSNLAEFLMDGDQKGDLKKSVEELEMFDPKALEDCKRWAILYSEQLFSMYQNKEDPFFRPSSIGC